MSKPVFIKPVSESKLVSAGTTLGIDEMFIAMKMSHYKKVDLAKAAFGRKDIKFRRPLLQWEQKYQKIKI